MAETDPRASTVDIPQQLLLMRLEQAEELREFTIQMWLQNPLLARQAGSRVAELLTRMSDTSPAEDEIPMRKNKHPPTPSPALAGGETVSAAYAAMGDCRSCSDR
ncbi:hypothetical protein [Sulfuricystis multivorans]|uniref:hypothetical protein n=1 Tax=Sulfuricystis multivorans TaxID=2211108 RepID=UPI000F81D096|nr:hypothetical protein [Sulfuricystis multivorans]